MQPDMSLVRDFYDRQRELEAAPVRMLDAASGRLDATTRMEGMISQGRRALLFAAAVSMVVIAGGIAWRIANPAAAGAAHARPAAVDGTATTGAPAGVPPVVVTREGAPLVRDFVLFTEAKVDGWTVSAGHGYPTSEAEHYDRAWCYTQRRVDGAQLRLELGTREYGAIPVFTPDPQTTAALGLDASDARRLFEACQWLDGPPAAAEGPREWSYALTGAVTTESVGRLIAAVESGARRIELSSPGGDMGAAFDAVEVLRRHDVDTVAVGRCSSACVLLFAAGNGRSVAPGGSIGVHQWAYVDPADANANDAQRAGADLLALYQEAGIAAEAFIVASRTPPDDIYTFSAGELTRFGITRGRS